jgi:hypothetical protein
MSADEFADWPQKSDKAVSADAHSKRAYRLAMTALVVALSALAVSTLVLLASLSTSLSPDLEPPTAVTPPPAISPPHTSDVMKTAPRAD